jgi:hypothetical protein
MRQTGAVHPIHIDFDEIDDWASQLADAVSHVVDESVYAALRSDPPRYIEDARNVLLRLANKEAVLDATLEWLRQITLVGYHGTRATDSECESIRRIGLKPLSAADRAVRLERALKRHPDWSQFADRLRETIDSVGVGERCGRREGQVHLTISRAGLHDGFNHYLAYGSEFDQNVAQLLLGKNGLKYLREDGIPRLVQVCVPGDQALVAAHRYFTVDDMRQSGEIPNIVREILQAFSFKIAHPDFQSRSLHQDCGLVFNRVVPPEWISAISAVEVRNPCY